MISTTPRTGDYALGHAGTPVASAMKAILSSHKAHLLSEFSAFPSQISTILLIVIPFQ